MSPWRRGDVACSGASAADATRMTKPRGNNDGRRWLAAGQPQQVRRFYAGDRRGGRCKIIANIACPPRSRTTKRWSITPPTGTRHQWTPRCAEMAARPGWPVTKVPYEWARNNGILIMTDIHGPNEEGGEMRRAEGGRWVGGQASSITLKRVSFMLQSTELFVWSLLVRAGIATLTLSRTLALLDRVPHRASPSARPVAFPTNRQVHFAGACLGRSLARSQFLRQRGLSHRLIIGVTGDVDAFHAHAWLDPFEAAPEGFVEVRRVER